MSIFPPLGQVSITNPPLYHRELDCLHHCVTINSYFHILYHMLHKNKIFWASKYINTAVEVLFHRKMGADTGPLFWQIEENLPRIPYCCYGHTTDGCIMPKNCPAECAVDVERPCLVIPRPLLCLLSYTWATKTRSGKTCYVRRIDKACAYSTKNKVWTSCLSIAIRGATMARRSATPPDVYNVTLRRILASLVPRLLVRWR